MDSETRYFDMESNSCISLLRIRYEILEILYTHANEQDRNFVRVHNMLPVHYRFV